MNIYFICVIARVQMWCVYAQLLDDQTQKDFWVFYLFLEVIFVTLVLKVFLKMSNSLCWKTVFGHFETAFASGPKSWNF